MNWEGIVIVVIAYFIVGYAVGVMTMQVLYDYLENYSLALHIFLSIFWTISLVIMTMYGIYQLARYFIYKFLAPEGTIYRKIQKTITVGVLITLIIMVLMIFFKYKVGV